jgi:tetratricopeptide (TPR) repeat protein
MMKKNICYGFLILISACNSPNKSQIKQVEEKDLIYLSDKQIDSLSTIMQQSALKNDIKKIDEIYNTYLKPNWKDTNNADFYIQRAHVNSLKWKYTNALKDVLIAQKLNPKYAYVYYKKGIILSMIYQNNVDSSLFYFNKAIDLDSNNVDYFQIRAETFNSIHNYQKAIDDINRAIKINPSDLQLYALRGAFLYSNKQYDLAIEDLNWCLKQKNQDNFFYFRGMSFYFKANYELALKDFEEAIKLNPNFGAYYTGRGVTKFKLKNRDAAFIDFKKAMDLGDQEGTKYYNDCLIWYSEHKKI